MTHRSDPPATSRTGFSRRAFLQSTGVAAAALTAGLGLGACTDDDGADGAGSDRPSGGESYSATPSTPDAPPDRTRLRFFTRAEARALQAVAGRLVPGDADDPGAVECDVLTYIDHKLHTYEGGFAQGIYREAPYVESEEDGGHRVDLTTTRRLTDEELGRYGYQSTYTYREIFRLGLAALDASVVAAGGTRFADLGDTDQDVVLAAIAGGTVKGFDPPGASTFFATVHRHVIEGMFCDPLYGGNRDLAAWKLVGYPGAQRAYTPEYLHGEVPEFEPQSIADMMRFNPGREGLGGEQVVSGSEGGHEHGNHPHP